MVVAVRLHSDQPQRLSSARGPDVVRLEAAWPSCLQPLRDGLRSFVGVVVLPSAASKYKGQARLRLPACAAALLGPPPRGCGRLGAGCCFYEKRHCARSCDYRHRDSQRSGVEVALPLQVRSLAGLDPGRGVAATCRGLGWHRLLSLLAEALAGSRLGLGLLGPGLDSWRLVCAAAGVASERESAATETEVGS